jgi:hypothetical protein
VPTLLCASQSKLFSPILVLTCVKHWMELSMSAQDTRVGHCDLEMLEGCTQRLCDLTNRDYTRQLFRSKQALASKIGDIFQWSLRGLLAAFTSDCTISYEPAYLCSFLYTRMYPSVPCWHLMSINRLCSLVAIALLPHRLL